VRSIGHPLIELLRVDQHFSEEEWGEGFSHEDFPGGKYEWGNRCCGIACIASVLHCLRGKTVSKMELLQRGFELNAYSTKGWIHSGLVDIASMYGVSGVAFPVESTDLLCEISALNVPILASVSNQLPVDGKVGGHLIALNEVTDTDVYFMDPSTWGKTNTRCSPERFSASFSWRIIVLWDDDRPLHSILESKSRSSKK
jgi:predicted double-glycine peptidase